MASENAKTYLSKQLSNTHFFVQITLKEPMLEEEKNALRENAGAYLTTHGGVVFHMRPGKGKLLQLYIVADKDTFRESEFMDWLKEQLKDRIVSPPSIVILTKP